MSRRKTLVYDYNYVTFIVFFGQDIEHDRPQSKYSDRL